MSPRSVARPRRSRLRAAALLAGILGSAGSARPAAAQDRPSEEALRSVEVLGRRIASYHEAIARARQHLHSQAPDLARDIRLVVVDRNGPWKVIVMRQAEGEAGARDWKMLAEIGFNPKAGDVTTMERFTPPKQASSDALFALRAIDTATAAITLRIPEAKAPFEEAVFKEPDKSYSVYLQPASEAGAAPRFGSDLHSQVSGDGMKVLKATALHGQAAWVPVPSGTKGEPTLHSHIEGDLPTATDVAAVLEHPGLAPHLVLTPRRMFRINQAGAITYLGPNEVAPAPPGRAP